MAGAVGELFDRAGQLGLDLDGEVIGEHLVVTLVQRVMMRAAIAEGGVLGTGNADTMSVSMNAACTPSTWVCCASSSRRSVLDTDQMAALDAP